MWDCAPHDVVGDVGVVPTTQHLRKYSVSERTLVIIIRHYALIRLQVPFAHFACALGVERRLPLVCMQTSQTRSTGFPRIHVSAMAEHHVFLTLIKQDNLTKHDGKKSMVIWE